MKLVEFSEKWPFVKAFSPWLVEPGSGLSQLPSFKRDMFEAIFSDVLSLPQMISVTGPRRVGKTTLLQQCIEKLIGDAPETTAQAQRILYFSMDDPALDLPGVNRDVFFNELVAAAVACSRNGATYLFLDEIQKFPRWELYLKKFYDLKTPVKFIVSGSASSPIFKKSRESLLGRIKDFHVLPFSFTEYAAVNSGFQGTLQSLVQSGIRETKVIGRSIQRMPMGDGFVVALNDMSRHLSVDDDSRSDLNEFLFSGGFPEVWQLPTLQAKQDYLYQNQIERVIYEDLLVAAEFRKPDMLRRFYIGLLKDPGRESNIAQLSKALELDRRTIESYFPLLEATDLVWRLHKHTSTKATPKAGNFKTYLVDLAVRNAVMRLTQEQMAADDTLMGHYAENVVANHLRRWPGLVELGYWRQNSAELDFIVDLGHSMIGIEVKYRNTVQHKEAYKAAALAKELGCAACIVVSKTPMDADIFAQWQKNFGIPVAVVPLAAFLMLF